MVNVTLTFSDGSLDLGVRALRGSERLGEAFRIEIDALAKEPVERSAILGQGCVVAFSGPWGERRIAGVVRELGSLATSDPAAARRHRLVITPWFGALSLRRGTKVFQKLSVPDIVKQVLKEGGYPDDAIKTSLGRSHAPREYVVQYDETDAAFVRRLCEEEGLYFRFEPGDAGDVFTLEDTSSAAPKALDAALPLVDESGLASTGAVAHSLKSSLRRRPGKVTLRDYNQEKPALKLEGVASAGTELEKQTEVYEAPGRFRDESGATARAQLRLESLRADADAIAFVTTAVALAPGLAVTLESTASMEHAARADGDFLVVEVLTQWQQGGEHTISVTAIPLAVPFRLPAITKRPRAHGLHSAVVTGAPGEEIHVDDQGRVRVRFHWDREGPADDESSLPIRVAQPNTPGSMLLPRVGWEVMVAFEDGDPDRPYVLGRTYNQKYPPPYALPANKHVSVMGTFSSPGGAKQNAIVLDDGGGAQNFSILAGFGKTTTVANNMTTQTASDENLTIKASQVRSVGGNEKVSVTQAYASTLGSQSATVGGTQKIFVKGNMTVDVGSETVLIGGACLEKVGNPVAGAANLATAAVMAGASAVGVPGAVVAAAGLAKTAYEGYQRGGLRGAAGAVGNGLLGMAGDAIMPGGGMVLGAIAEAHPPPWAEQPAGGGGSAGAGGAGGASDNAAAQGPGPGHRNTIVDGSMTELVGGAYGVATPGSVGWTTIGPSTLLVGGSHTIKAGQAGSRTLGAATDLLGSLSITTAGNLTRDITGAVNTTIAGTLSSKAGGKHSIEAGGALTLTIGGALTMKGSHVTFICGSSKVSTSPAGVLIEASTITITGSTKQSGATSAG